MAAASGTARILELGTALGYTACWFARASPTAQVDTIERDPEHVRLARQSLDRFGFGDRVRVIQADFADALTGWTLAMTSRSSMAMRRPPMT